MVVHVRYNEVGIYHIWKHKQKICALKKFVEPNHLKDKSTD